MPPSREATALTVRKSQPHERDRAIKRIRKVGRRRWNKESGYHRQGRVENTSFRMESIVGGRLRSRDAATQAAEAMVACNVLNRMFGLSRPRSVPIPK